MNQKTRTALFVIGLLFIPGVVAIGEFLAIPKRSGHPITGAVIGYYVSMALALAIYYLRPLIQHRKRCPECNLPLPKVLRLPANLNRFFRGGWICPGCGCEVNRHGQELLGRSIQR